MNKQRIRKLENVLTLPKEYRLRIVVYVVNRREPDDPDQGYKHENSSGPMKVIQVHSDGVGPDISAFFTDSGVEPTEEDLKTAYIGPWKGYEDWREQQEAEYDKAQGTELVQPVIQVLTTGKADEQTTPEKA